MSKWLSDRGWGMEGGMEGGGGWGGINKGNVKKRGERNYNLKNLQNFKFLLQYQAIKQKLCKNKTCAKYDNLHIFEKLLPWRIQICKNICKIVKCKSVFKKNWKCANSLQRRMFLLSKAFQRAIISRNSMTGRRFKYKFSRVKVK